MEIKKYKTWLTEKVNSTKGCHQGGFRTQSISMEEVLKNAELAQLYESQVNESTKDVGPFKAGLGGLSAAIDCAYAAGYYSVDHTTKKTPSSEPQTFKNSDRFKVTLNQMLQFLNDSPDKSFVSEVWIKSSESIIPNFDTEGGGGQKPTGWLSNMRKEKIGAYVNSIMEPLVKSGKVSKLPTIKYEFLNAKTLVEPSGGWNDYRAWKKAGAETTSEKGQEYTALRKGYEADQSTKVQFRIAVDLGEGQCMEGLRFEVSYDDERVKHHCDDAKFQISVNGIQLSTIQGGKLADGYLPAGLPYANMNNTGDPRTDDLKRTYRAAPSADSSAYRKNVFGIVGPAMIKQVMAAAGPSKEILVRAKCIVNGNGWKPDSPCHKDAPHVYVYKVSGPNKTYMEGFAGGGHYPKTNDGVIIRTTFCGKNKEVQNVTPPAGSDSKTAVVAGPKLTGVKLGIAAPKIGTLTTAQIVANKLTSGHLVKQPDGKTYLVKTAFTIDTVSYEVGDIIDKVLPQGTVVTRPPVKP
jgi:hypothetical protein